MYGLLLVVFSLLPGNWGSSVFLTSENEDFMVSVVHTSDYDAIEVRQSVVDAKTLAKGFESLPDFALVRAPVTGSIYFQWAWWQQTKDDKGEVWSEQTFSHWVFFTPED